MVSKKRKTTVSLTMFGVSFCIPVVVIVTIGVIGAPDWTESWELLDNLAPLLLGLGAMLAFSAPLMLKGRSLGVRVAWGIGALVIYGGFSALTLYASVIVFGLPIR